MLQARRLRASWSVGLAAPEPLARSHMAGRGRWRFIRGINWIMRAAADFERWPAERQLALLLAIPTSSTTWTLLGRSSADLAGQYWRSVNPSALAAVDIGNVVRNLLNHDRAWAAVDLLSWSCRREDADTSVPPTALIVEVLRAALGSDNVDDLQAGAAGYEGWGPSRLSGRTGRRSADSWRTRVGVLPDS